MRKEGGEKGLLVERETETGGERHTHTGEKDTHTYTERERGEHAH